MEVIKRAYIKIFNKNLPIYGVTSKDLRDFTTTEKDLKKSVSRFPLPEMRLNDEDLLKVTPAEQVTAKMSEVVLDEKEDFATQQSRRQQQLASESSMTSSTADEEDPNSFAMDEQDRQVRMSMAGGGENIFSRDQTKARLQDFEFRKLIGKGTFGKVFLVQNKINQQLYAMKCIRKDVILENEQMENIQLEKDILYSI